MSEGEWLICSDPTRMLKFVGANCSTRKFRLLGCGLARQIWHLLTDERSRAAVEISERYADGLAEKAELDAAIALAMVVADGAYSGSAAPDAAAYATSTAVDTAAALSVQAMALALSTSADAVACAVAETTPDKEYDKKCEAARTAHCSAQCCLLRDMFGPLPFRRVTLQGLTPVVTTLAGSIYAEGAWDRLPILGDSLEEAGCTDVEILGHCRAATSHVRGCWVVDLVLGKE
ncbi:hypothetical protein AYO40_04900 [Planctomycetaceae bacterium SCGC AG-212-D15]|nr:hypothetical protein AYO40_04900 [Planctomycetaceae bacterium SCGC AG-212-D15]